MAIALIQSEFLDDYRIELSEDAIDQYIRRYQAMLAARQQDTESLRREYESVAEIILSIDGLQPEKGHETLYVVRELTQKRVWFAEALISATEDEVRCLIRKAREWAESLAAPVGLWVSALRTQACPLRAAASVRSRPGRLPGVGAAIPSGARPRPSHRC
jgi:hypothetical protein